MTGRSRPLAWSGVALAAGGALTLLINAGLTPALPTGASFAETATSAIFLWRQSLSALAALLLLAGSVGLYLHQAERAGRFGALTFVLAFVGSAMLFALEWCQVIYVRGLARQAPETLEALDAAPGMSLYDIGAMIALGAFTLGWILFAVSLLLAGVYGRRGPVLVIGGFFAIPILTAVLPGLWGAAVGNAILGSGWMVLGYEVFVGKRPNSAGRTAFEGGK